ncbi:DUF2513 domain-containing protein [Methylobacterium sp. WL12]|uniref:DUF2513 domain-containing protein n=1 Tax=Methylobacterium sp. WL12 TaxID=2603890 RepID=UPI00164F30EE|nr:DUF2513 domain-containing protein [Methylobacterium sp. WL12]
MKRDMDFVRKLLLQIEEGETTFVIDFLTAEDDHEMEEIRKLRHHLIIMVEANLINVMEDSFLKDSGRIYAPVEVVGLTWKGHDFVDTIRDPEMWRTTKEGASKVGGAGFGFILELGKAYAKQELQKLGLPLS